MALLKNGFVASWRCPCPYITRKVWFHQIWIQNYLGFIVLILIIKSSFQLDSVGIYPKALPRIVRQSKITGELSLTQMLQWVSNPQRRTSITSLKWWNNLMEGNFQSKYNLWVIMARVHLGPLWEMPANLKPTGTLWQPP